MTDQNRPYRTRRCVKCWHPRWRHVAIGGPCLYSGCDCPGFTGKTEAKA